MKTSDPVKGKSRMKTRVQTQRSKTKKQLGLGAVFVVAAMLTGVPGAQLRAAEAQDAEAVFSTQSEAYEALAPELRAYSELFLARTQEIQDLVTIVIGNLSNSKMLVGQRLNSFLDTMAEYPSEAVQGAELITEGSPEVLLFYYAYQLNRFKVGKPGARVSLDLDATKVLLRNGERPEYSVRDLVDGLNEQLVAIQRATARDRNSQEIQAVLGVAGAYISGDFPGMPFSGSYLKSVEQVQYVLDQVLIPSLAKIKNASVKRERIQIFKESLVAYYRGRPGMDLRKLRYQ